ncbi:autotransporter domain-containing protein [Amphritea sp. HPY]|uniref:autotransporter family protein n=1 Tax=Amphritea sp. HPY TaxID=3421652 RepID=UPI003D7CB697
MDSATITELDNSGTIEGLGPSGADSSGIYADSSEITTLLNTSLNSIRGTDHGIYLDSSSINSLTNTGLIYGGDEPSTTSGDTDTGITVTNGGLITSLDNSGIISGYDGDADDDTNNDGSGLIIDAGGEITTLNNSGTIIGDDYAILITGGNAITINNSGVLSGDVDLDSTASVINLTGSSARIIGDTSGSATTVNVLSNFTTEGSFNISEMTIDNNAELALYHDITAAGAGGLSNNGVLAISPGQSDNLTLTGNYNQAPSGTLIVDYNSAMGPGNEGNGSDLLSISGDAVIAGKILFSSSDTVDVASTTPIKIIEAGSVSFTGEIEGIQGSFGDLSSFGGSFTNSLGFAALASDPDPVAVNAADNVVLDTTALFLSGSCGFNSTAADRQRSGGIYRHSHGDCLTPGRSTLKYDNQEQDAWWVRTILTKGAQASTIDSNGYKYKTYGLIAGKSVSQDENWSSGISIGMLRGKADKNNGGSDNTDSAYVGLQRDYIDGEHFYNMALTLGLNKFDFERNMTIDGNNVQGTGDTMGWTLGARIAAGLEQKTGDNSYARPMVSLSYSQLHKQGYNESGLADFGLQIEDQTLRDLRANLGVEVSYDFPAEKSSAVIESTLAVKLGMSHQQALDNRQYNVRFTNFADPFIIEGDNSSLTMMRLGLGWTRHIDRSSNMFIGYDAGFSSEREEHTLNFGLRKVW